MKQAYLTIALILSFASVGGTGELRSNRGNSSQRSSRSASPGVTARSRDARAESGTLRANNTGLESLRIAARAVREAAACTQGQLNSSTTSATCHNVEKTNQHRTMNLTNLQGCKLIRSGTASGYGCTSDKFFRGRTSASGIVFNPTAMTAACSPSLKGQIVIVRRRATNVARAVTCIDTGAFESKYGRVIDLAQDVFEQFGLRCDKDGLIPNIELYKCPNT